ncbi:MAG: hypothetical protein K0Q93_2154 [Nocardioidaceae bacterium]|jgi:hypothetical protein|nr:hypothetical protein [Nocardioidaceae bacterium]
MPLLNPDGYRVRGYRIIVYLVWTHIGISLKWHRLRPGLHAELAIGPLVVTAWPDDD